MLHQRRVFRILQEKIKNKIPFALLRYGDGEGIFCRYFKQFDNTLYRKASIKHWNEVPNLANRKIIAENIKASYLNCDMAGIPPLQWKGNWLTARNYFLCLNKKKQLTTIDIHIYLTHEGYLHELIKNKPVFYVSCRNVDNVLKQKFDVSDVKSLIISPQAKFEQEKITLPFYLQLPSIEKKIKTMDLTGKICFLGAGVAGKNLGILMKKQGGIVIDIGSVFDYWTGIITRSWIKKYM